MCFKINRRGKLIKNWTERYTQKTLRAAKCKGVENVRSRGVIKSSGSIQIHLKGLYNIAV